MNTYKTRRWRGRQWAGSAFFLTCALAFFAWSRTAPEPSRPEEVVFSMAVTDSAGGVLASPVVMGETGQTLKIRLVCEDDPSVEKMHVTLDPMGVEDGALLYSYELSVAGHVDTQRGTVKLAMGREKRIRIHPNDVKGVTFSLYAEPLARYMARRKAHPGRIAS